MSGMYGADVGQLRALAQQFDGAAERLEQCRGVLSSMLQATVWNGPDAARFRQEWETEAQRAIVAAAARLREAGVSTRSNASDQELTSAVDGGGGGAAPAPMPRGESWPGAPINPGMPLPGQDPPRRPVGPGDEGMPLPERAVPRTPFDGGRIPEREWWSDRDRFGTPRGIRWSSPGTSDAIGVQPQVPPSFGESDEVHGGGIDYWFEKFRRANPSASQEEIDQFYARWAPIRDWSAKLRAVKPEDSDR